VMGPPPDIKRLTVLMSVLGEPGTRCELNSLLDELFESLDRASPSGAVERERCQATIIWLTEKGTGKRRDQCYLRNLFDGVAWPLW
jgi:hypothetical protein